MRNLVLLLLATFALPGQVVPIALHGPVVVVKVRLNGQGPFRMVVDTGATSCSVLPKVAAKLQLRPEYRVLDITPSEKRWIPGNRSVTVELGAQIAANVEFLWRRAEGFTEAGLDVDGVLGQSLLSRFDYLIDYKSRQLVLDSESHGNSGAPIPFVRVAGRMLLPAANPSALSMHLILDSAASNVYLWRRNDVPDVGPTAVLITMYGRRFVNLVRMRMLAVGDQILHQLDAVVAPPPDVDGAEDGLLPAVLFRSVYVSNSESYVKLQK